MTATFGAALCAAVAGVLPWKEKVGVRNRLGIALVLIQFGRTAG
jgi:hypothetical protein